MSDAPPPVAPDPFPTFNRQAAQEAALDSLLPHAGAEGWTLAALRRHAGQDSDLLFPGGTPEMIEAHIGVIDRRMAAMAGSLGGMRLPEKVRALILARLQQCEAYRPAIRKALAVLALPPNAGLSARTLARTADAIWTAAGDRSADFSWYTKRAILASVYASTLLFWLNDRNSMEDCAAFLDRRLEGVAQITRWRRKLSGHAA